MRPLFALLTLLSAAGCASLTVDVEGLRCDEQNPCGPGYACTAGHCSKSSTNTCANVTCATPPARACQDAATLRVYAEQGTCSPEVGECRYLFTDTACAQGCESGACKGDPCAGVSCAQPPATACVDATTLRSYGQTGVCQAADGRCVYAPTDIACANGCEAGRCKDQDLCAGKTCDAPPAAACVPGSVRVWSKPGTCEMGTGQCSYPFTDTPCTGTCTNGVCMPAAALLAQVGPRVRSRVTAVDQVASAAGSHVVVVGPAGYAAKWNGSTWTQLSTGTTKALTSVWLASPTLGYAVGQGGTLLRYDGTAFTQVNTGVPTAAAVDFIAVHGLDASHVLVAAESGFLLRYDGSAWAFTGLPAGGYKVTGAWVSPGGDDRLSAQCGVATLRPCILYSPGLGKAFFPDVDNGAGTTEGFRAVGPSPTGPTYSLAGLTGSARRYVPTPTFSSLESPSGMLGGPVLGISEGTAGSVFVLTAAAPAVPSPGRLYRWTAGGFDPGESLVRFYGLSQAMSRSYSGGVIVSDSGANSATILRRGVITDEALEVGEDWQSVAVRPGGGVVLMSPYGELALRPDAGGPGTFARPAVNALFYQVAAATSFALTAGASGRLYKWPYAGPLTPVTTATAANLRALCRVSDTELYAVGDGGAALKYDGNASALMSSGTTKNLTGITCLGPGSAIAVGDAGTVLRLSGGSWAPYAPAFPDASAALARVSSNASGTLVVSAGSAIWRSTGGGAFQPIAAAPGVAEALVLRDEGDLYAATGKNVARFDGSGWTTAVSASFPLLAGTRAGARLVFVGADGAVVDGK